jgi:hypothetical protein
MLVVKCKNHNKKVSKEIFPIDRRIYFEMMKAYLFTKERL